MSVSQPHCVRKRSEHHHDHDAPARGGWRRVPVDGSQRHASKGEACRKSDDTSHKTIRPGGNSKNPPCQSAMASKAAKDLEGSVPEGDGAIAAFHKRHAAGTPAKSTELPGQGSSKMGEDAEGDQDDAQVPLLQKICYGAVSFSTLSLSLLINAFGIDFYVQLGALLPIISLFTAIARSFDIVTDLSMGWFSDNFRSPYGRRRPFMALGCIPYGLCFFFFFLPPITADSFGISMYFGLFYTAFYLSDTIATVPYDALGPELSTNYKERNTIFFLARLFQLSGSVVVSITPAIMQSVLVSMGWTTLSAMRTSLAVTAGFFGLWYILSTFACVFTIKERPVQESTSTETPLVPSILRSFRNKAIDALIVAWVLDGLQLAVLVTLFPFYIRYYIQPDGPAAQANGFPFSPTTFIGMSITLLFVGGAISTPVWLYLAQRMGKWEAWVLNSLVLMLTNLVYLIPREGQNLLVLAVMFLKGVPNGGLFLNNSIMADVIDYEELLNGSRSEGTFSVYGTLVNKTVAIPGAAIPLGILSLLGFINPINGINQAQPGAVMAFIFFGITLFPAACAAVVMIPKLRFPIQSRDAVANIQMSIKKLAAGEAALDPLTGKILTRPELSEEEHGYYWCLQHFGPSSYPRIIAASGSMDGIVAHAAMKTVLSIVVSGALGVWAISSLALLAASPRQSVVATMAVISAVFSLCCTYVSISGLLGARKLRVADPAVLVKLAQKLRSCSGDGNGRQLPAKLPEHLDSNNIDGKV